MASTRGKPQKSKYGVKTYSHLGEAEQLKKAKNYTLWVLEKGNKTENELRTKLRRKECSENVIDNCILWAKEYNFINDYTYAEMYTEQFLISGKTLRWIRNKLQHKGIPRNIIEESITIVGEKTELLNEESAQERAMNHGAVVMRRLRNENDERKKKQKFTNSMMRSGYNYEEIKKTWEQLTPNEN